jgi:hypothetical protein
VLLLCLGLVGCNKNKPSSAASAPPSASAPATPTAPAKIPDFQFEPLTQQDVDLYLSIMRLAAAQKAQLSPADQKVLADEQNYYAHLKSGWHPDPTPAEVQLFTKANALHHLDDEIARQQGKHDLYVAVRDAIEGMVGPMKCGDSDCGTEVPEQDPKLRAQQLHDEARRKKTIQQDLVLLLPHQAEITQLATELREIPHAPAPAKKNK